MERTCEFSQALLTERQRWFPRILARIPSSEAVAAGAAQSHPVAAEALAV